MALTSGTRLGPYEIVAAIGAGGMGEVYRGRDTRLDRTVAIKVLPDAVARDAERLARFEREAKTLAVLNHANIAQIYGLEQGALAMEFVEGEDLSAKIARGPIPIDDALEIAEQIADALEAPHEHGIVHRDLKSSNIRIRDDGMVKVLDFGLAKALAPAVERLSGTAGSTITTPAMTGLGTILGTAAYMAPEQAKGRAVDKRADIWAFGVVLYEMVTGRRPFDGESVSETLAAVIKSDPDWSAVPPQLQRLLRSSLEKDPKRRLRDIGDWTRQLDEPSSTARREPALALPWLAWSAAAILLMAVTALAFVHFREAAAAAENIRFEIPPPEANSFDVGFAVAPDGRRVAFVARDGKGVSRLWIRDFDALEARPLAGTEGARSPSWKPDGQFVAFVVDRALKKVSIKGGPAVTLCEVNAASGLGGGAWSWSPQGVIVFGGVAGGVMRRVSESGGPITPLTALDPQRRDLVHGIASFLPDGRHFVYLRVSAIIEQSGIFVGSIDRTPAEQDRQPLLAIDTRAQFAMMGAQGGRLLYLRQGTLMAQPFDPDRLVLTGEATPVAERVSNSGAAGSFSATTNALAYRTGPISGAGRASRLTWVDRQGNPGAAVGAPGPYVLIELSPDGRRAGVTVQPNLNPDVWLVDLDRDGLFTRLTTSPTADRASIWPPDGSRIAFQSNRNGPMDLYVKNANGSGGEDLLLKSDRPKQPTSWSHDGQFLLYQTNHLQTGSDLWVLPLQGDRTPIPVIEEGFAQAGGRFSPDDHWIAYQSNVSGQDQIYVRAFNPLSPGKAAGGVTQVSKDGGVLPRWRRDGRELFFEGPDGSVMAVDVTLGAEFRPGVPRALFQLPSATSWDPAPDGKRFLVAMPTTEQGRTPITVVLNWAAAGK